MRRFLWLSLGAVFLASVAVASSGGATQAEARWVITDLGTLGGKESYAAAINSKGRVVGWAETKNGRKQHPFLWHDGRMSNLDAGSGWSAWATEINDHGQVIGQVDAVWDETDYDKAASGTFGFVWRPGSLTGLHGGDERAQDEPGSSQVLALNDRGTMVGWLGAYGDAIPYQWSVPTKRGRDYYPFHDGVALSKTRWGRAYDINERGQVVGYSYRSYEDPTHAALWENRKLTDLGVLPGRTGSRAVAINDAGQIVGNSFGKTGARGFLWQEGEMLNLGRLAGLPNSAAVTLNERGQVIGFGAKAFSWWGFFGSGSSPPTYGWSSSWQLPKRPRAFLWQDGTLTDLGTLGGTSAIPFAINEAGQIVGQSQNAKGSWHAFVWQKGRMRELSTLGGKFSAALAINDAGQIVGWSRTPKDVKHAVLWTLKR